MQRFLLHTALFLVVFTLVFELTLHTFGLATDVLMFRSIDRKLLFQPGQRGCFLRGMRGEVRARYHINRQGWNSTIDYDLSAPYKLAILGDSFIEGFYTDVDSAIGRQVEALLEDGIVVHQYGRRGANIHDYNNLLDELAPAGYAHTFVYLNVEDLFYPAPEFTDTDRTRRYGSPRHWYNRLAIPRYLNVQLKLQLRDRLPVLWQPQPAAPPQPSPQEIEERFNALARPGIVYLYDDPRLASVRTHFLLLPIEHRRRPIDYGFDRHWNGNGVRNVAETVADYVQEKGERE